MEGRQGKNARMDRLQEVVENDRAPDSKPKRACAPHRVTFSGLVHRILGQYADMLVEDLLFMLPEGPEEPGKSEVHVVEWGGCELAATLTRDPETGCIETRVGMHITPERTGVDLFEWLEQEKEPGEDEEV